MLTPFPYLLYPYSPSQTSGRHLQGSLLLEKGMDNRFGAQVPDSGAQMSRLNWRIQSMSLK
jgi:hypothetical protein